jgi:transposase
VAATGTTLTSLFGAGPVIAARILAEAGDISRFAAKDKPASCNGTAPVDVSSGDQVRRRLSRAGNRRISHALHMMAVTQVRCPWTGGRRSCERKRAEGKTPKEALRCLRRQLSGQACRQLALDRRGRIEARGSPATRPPVPPASTSPASGSAAAAPASPPPRPGASRRSSSWTGKTTASPASKSSTPAPASTPTSSTRRKSPADTGAT